MLGNSLGNAPRWAWLLVATACAGAPPPEAPPPQGGPAPAGASPEHIWQAYLDAQPHQLKLRHQVLTRFAGREEVVEGVLLLHPPDSFWVRAFSPLGTTLFDVRQLGSHLQTAIHLPEIDARGPQYLARDIHRIYLHRCPSSTPAQQHHDHIVVTCDLQALGPPIDSGQGIDPPDDRLSMVLTQGGLLLKKEFFARGQPTATVTYGGYSPEDALRWAHHIALSHGRIPYTLEIRLLAADPDFDVVAALERLQVEPGSEAPPH